MGLRRTSTVWMASTPGRSMPPGRGMGRSRWEDIFHTSVAPNAYRTYHYWLSIRIDPKERGHYRCQVDIALKERTSSECNLEVIIIYCVVLVLICASVIWLRIIDEEFESSAQVDPHSIK